jgi:hypothetical protein
MVTILTFRKVRVVILGQVAEMLLEEVLHGWLASPANLATVNS